MAHIFGSIWDRFNRNALNNLSKSVEQHGKSIQDLVAKGQLTPTQYAELIKNINGMIASGEISIHDINKNKGKIDQTFLTQELIDAITGSPGANILSEIADGSVTSNKVAKKAITPSKVDFLKKTRNLFDGEYYGIQLSFDAGLNKMKYRKSDTHKTAIIPILPSKQYHLKTYKQGDNDAFRVALSDSEINLNSTDWVELEDTLVSNSNTTKELSFTNTNGRSFLVVNVTNESFEEPPILQLEVGSAASEYTPPYVVPEFMIDEDFVESIKGWERISEVKRISNIATGFVSGSIGNNGQYTENSTIVVSENAIPFDGSHLTLGLYNRTSEASFGRVAFFGESNTHLYNTEWMDLKVTQVLQTPEGVGSVKIAVNAPQENNVFANEGDTPYFEMSDVVVSSGFEELVPDGVVKRKHLSKELKENIDGRNLELKPFPQKINFKTLRDDDYIKVYHLDSEGTTLYAGRISYVMQSLDDGDTWEQVVRSPNGLSIMAVRDLDDGEILFTTKTDPNSSVKAKIFKTQGYNKNDLSNVSAYEVLSAIGIRADFNNDWCLEVHDNIVVANEYGVQGEDNARHAFLSTDYGQTWTQIFDQKLTTANIAGAPAYTENAHLHTVHYDRYSERIWLAAGDQENCATYFSDDMGATWDVVPGSTGLNAVQYTGIISYPEATFFGTDRTPEGIHYWKRGEPLKIELYFGTYRGTNRTLVYAKPFRRYTEIDEVTYFSADRDISVNGEMSSLVVAFKGDKGASIIYDFEDVNLTKITGVVGNTKKGNVVCSVQNEVTGYYHLMRGKSPFWG